MKLKKYTVILNHFEWGNLTYHVKAANPNQAESKALIKCSKDLELFLEDTNEDTTTAAIYEGHLKDLKGTL